MNHKIILHKERLQRMLMLIKGQEEIEDCFGFDQNYVKAKESEMIEEYSAELAALNQLAFDQIATHKNNNARSLGTIVINENGIAKAIH